MSSECDHYLNGLTEESPLFPLLFLSAFSLLCSPLFFLFVSVCFTCLYSTMAPKKAEQKKEVAKPSPEPETPKEPDFDPKSITVCLLVWSLWLFFFFFHFQDSSIAHLFSDFRFASSEIFYVFYLFQIEFSADQIEGKPASTVRSNRQILNWKHELFTNCRCC